MARITSPAQNTTEVPATIYTQSVTDNASTLNILPPN